MGLEFYNPIVGSDPDWITKEELLQYLREGDDSNHDRLGNPSGDCLLSASDAKQLSSVHAAWGATLGQGLRHRFGFCPDSNVPFRVPLNYAESGERHSFEVYGSPVVLPTETQTREGTSNYNTKFSMRDLRRDNPKPGVLSPLSQLRFTRGDVVVKRKTTLFKVGLKPLALMVTTGRCPVKSDRIPDDMFANHSPIGSLAQWVPIDWNLDVKFAKEHGEWPLQPVEARNRVRYSYHGPHDFDKMKHGLNVSRLADIEYDQQADAFDLELDPSAFLFRAYQIPGVGQVRHDVLAFYAMHGRLPDDWRELRKNGVNA
jgi:hypothetical protein